MDSEIELRIKRIYAAIGEAIESDLSKLKTDVIQNNKVTAIFQDFRGGLSNEQLTNIAHSFIHNISNLQDHLRKWAKQNDYDKNEIKQTFNNSLYLKIIQDLSDNDKHGYPRHNGGYSKKYPQLVNINRVMKLQTQEKKGSTIGMALGPYGVPKLSGDGTAKVVITGDVVDNDNNRIGDLHKIATKAVEAWEQLLADFGLIARRGERT